MRLLYSIALFLLLPWALLHLLLRARRQPAYLEHVAERFGFPECAAEPSLIWIHAVSVGETRAAEPLIDALRRSHPEHRILLTHTTPTGRQTGIELFGNDVLRCYLPYDFPFAVKRFLRHFRPQVGIMMETEIWPNLIAHCHRNDIPVYLVNARMSEKSMRGYLRLRSLTSAALRTLAGIAAQGGLDAERLAKLGAGAVDITGNIKFDREVPPQMLSLGDQFRDWCGTRKVLLAASTREGEEALLLDMLEEINTAELLVVIVPRHPQRFDDLAALLGQRKWPFMRRSDNRSVGTGIKVVLGDSMGELFAYYAACDIAFVGGSLRPSGGQNLLEACAIGRPVIVGPHTFNFEEVTNSAIAAGAAMRVRDERELGRAVQALLNDPDRRKHMSDAGKRFTELHRGATARTLELLKW